MIKKFLYLCVVFLLLAGAISLVWMAPYHIYTLALTEGVNTRFLSMPPSADVLYDGSDLEILPPENMIDESFYEKFHFSHFEFPMPINHSLFSLIPLIKIEGIGPRLGASFQTGKNDELFTFMLERPYKFETTFGNQKLFMLPIFKNYILRKSNAEIWKDLFRKKLSLPSNEGKSFYQSLISLRKVTYNDLVYNLFILYNRKFLAPEGAINLSFFDEKSIGIIEIKSLDPNILEEMIYTVEKGFVYPVYIKTKRTSKSAMNFRKKFIRELAYKESSSDSAISIYARYKQIPYVKRIDQQGMTYLYSAWSHDLMNQDFIRVIILFLERGKLNLKYLKPFYEFSYKKFGSTLSSESKNLSEKAPEMLKRKMDEELKNDIKKENEMPDYKDNGEFSGAEEKIRYNLEKAKEKKKNSDDDQKLLIE